MDLARDYKDWSHESLIQRVIQLEQELKRRNSSVAEPAPKTAKKVKAEREFDPNRYSTRLIALKFAYLGKRYNGFEYHANNATPLPTIEEELWKALDKGKLILPKDVPGLPPGEINWEGCDYSKCGRTDKGVSAFGQVIGIRVRSNRPLRKRKASDPVCTNGDGEMQDVKSTKSRRASQLNASPNPPNPQNFVQESEELSILSEQSDDAHTFDPIADEISYPMVLNRLLPPDIRILAWCPTPHPDFSARFSCRERQYKYFFTQPAFPPIPDNLDTNIKGADSKNVKDGWLDIEAMREAAKSFVGLHDFRNFCKVDPSKQIVNFERRIFHAEIVKEDTISTLGYVNSTGFLPEGFQPTNRSMDSSLCPKVYSFTLHGSAFLWHQVRHMVAILFLVGQGLESPSIVSQLLDVAKNPRRPMYEMANDTPLVLWNCIFPHNDDGQRNDALQWIHVGDEAGRGDVKYGSQALMENLWKQWRERKIDEVLAATLIDVVVAQGKDPVTLTETPRKSKWSQKVFDGGNAARLQGMYIPVMKKPQLESPEVINDKYAVRKGFQSAVDLKNQGFRREKKPEGIAEDVDE